MGWSSDPAPSSGKDPLPETLLEKLKEQLKTPSLILVRDPNDEGKTALVAKLISEMHDRPCFYFSFQFARNNPEDYSFLTAIGDFLEAKGFLTETSRKRFWVEVLLENNGIIVLDDLPISLEKTRRTIESGICRASFPKVFYPALSVLNQMSKGNLIVCLPDSMPPTWKGDFLNLTAIAPDLVVAEITLLRKQENQRSSHSIIKGLTWTG
jgi:hypothetical protein